MACIGLLAYASWLKGRIAREKGDKIRQLQHSHQLILNSVGEGICQVDPYGKISYCNPYVLRVSGYSLGELVGRPYTALIPASAYPANRQRGGADWKNGRTEESFFRKDGSRFPVEYEAIPVYGPKGKKGTAFAFQDITRQEQFEDMLIRSEKLAVLGQLSAGVVHELRNPLASMRGFLQLMRTDPQKVLYFDIMERELQRIEGIVNNFLLVSKPQATRIEVTDPRRIVQNVANLLEPQLLLNRTRINLDFAEDAPQVLCNEERLEQVLLNLMKNAIEAMPAGGTVTVTLDRAQGSAGNAGEVADEKMSGERSDGQDELRVRISDEGVGMSKEQIARLGEPFFSTKEGGTGLGLAVCLQIIRAYRGRMDVTSELGRGTHFEIRLPAAKQ